MEKPNIELLNKSLIKHNIRIKQDELEKLWAFHKLIILNNKDRDLTRIINFEAMVTKHYVDCLILQKFFTSKTPLLDIGSGAGFPGIPLKILNPKVSFTLAEPKPSRIKFLETVIKELKLENIEVYPHKIVRQTSLPKFNTIITRAFETIPKTLFRVEKLLMPNSKIIFMKGPGVEKEKGEAGLASPFFKLEKDISYKISNVDERRLIIFTYLKPRQEQS